jgi:hypothetical protein
MSFIKKHGSVNSERLGHYGGLSLDLQTNQESYIIEIDKPDYVEGIQIMIHSPAQEPLLESCLLIKPHMYATISLKQRQIWSLPTSDEQSSCIDTEQDGFVNPLKHFAYYSLTACKLECHISYLRQICSDYKNYIDEDKCVKAAYTYAINLPTDFPCNCKRECHITEYTVNLSLQPLLSDIMEERLLNMTSPLSPTQKDLLTKQKIQLFIHYDELGYTAIQQQAAYPLLSAFGEIGGMLGLCLGASLLTVIELIEVFTKLCIQSYRKRHAKNEKQMEEGTVNGTVDSLL